MKRLFPLSLYWKCQLAGWAGAALYWMVIGMMGKHFNPWEAVLHFVLDVTMYILITHLFRMYSLQHGWQELKPRALLIRLIPAVGVLAMAYLIVTFSKTWLIHRYLDPGYDQTFTDFAKEYTVPMFMAGIRLMSIWLLAYYMYHYSRREIRSERENARLTLMARDARYEQLTAQLNPHFFFNSLNSIKALITIDPQQARRAMDLLSDLLRSSLNGREKMMISLQEEIGLVTDYLELEKLRLGDRLQVKLEVEPTLLNQPVLPLSIQLLVENALKHGIAPSIKGGMVSIQVGSENGTITAMVEGPGQLTKDHANKGLGLQNLEERLQLRYGTKASFKLIQSTESSVLAILKIPRQ